MLIGVPTLLHETIMKFHQPAVCHNTSSSKILTLKGDFYEKRKLYPNNERCGA